MATISKLPSGKFRAQIRRQGVYRAQTFSRKLDAQVWAAELERAIESGSSRGTIQPSAGLLLSDLIEAYTRQAKVSRAAELALLQIGRSIGQIPVRQLNALHVFDWIQQRQGDGLKTASILRSLGRFSRLLQWARDIKNIDIGANSVKRILNDAGIHPSPERRKKKPALPWTTFIRAHMETIVACDFFSKTVFMNRAGFAGGWFRLVTRPWVQFPERHRSWPRLQRVGCSRSARAGGGC